MNYPTAKTRLQSNYNRQGRLGKVKKDMSNHSQQIIWTLELQVRIGQFVLVENFSRGLTNLYQARVIKSVELTNSE